MSIIKRHEVRLGNRYGGSRSSVDGFRCVDFPS